MTAISYPLATLAWSEEEYEAIQRVIESGMFTMGDHVREFEKRFADFMGAKYCVMVNSGSSANLLMIAAMRFRRENPLRPKDEVIVPAVSWSTTYYPLQQYGLKLKFVDIDIDTLNYDLAALDRAITDKTKAVMVVNLLGNPNDFEVIQKIIGGKDIIVLEDNCESMCARYNGRYTGTFGLMGTFSTFFSHHMSTMEGGLVITDDEELYHIMLSLRAHGWTRNLPQYNKVTGVKSEDSFVESYKFVLPGYNLRPLELSGAIGIEQLKKLPAFVAERRRNADKFKKLMKNYPQFRIQQEIGESSWFGFSLIIEKGADLSRKDIVQSLSENHIECRPIVAGNFTKNEVLRWFDYEISETVSNAEWVDNNGFFIGNHHYPLDEELDLLRKVLDRVVSKT